jgi:OmpA-OmpF porin, OOP family
MTLRSLFLGLLASLAAAATNACPLADLQTARDAPAARAALAAVIEAGPECGAAQRDWAGRVAALHVFLAAEARNRAGDLPAAMRLAEEAVAASPIWRALTLRGDLRQRLPGPGGLPDYAAASLDYQEALNAIHADDARLDPVPEALIAAIWRKAEQTRLLADRPVASPPNRSGSPGGIASRTVRSFAPVSVAMPIQFVFARCDFTPGGELAAADLWRLLEADGLPPIRLVGHTDPIGSDEHNLRLSACRARAVAEYLVRRGYPPQRIQAEGRGEREPLRIEEPSLYSEAQLHQILRRVELVR